MQQATIIIEGKVLGQKQPVFSDWRIELPPIAECGGDRLRLRDLITWVVVEEINAFRQRQTERRLARILSKSEIERGSIQGKIDPGERDLKQVVDPETAIGAALQAFEDGLYFVFVDRVQQTDLEQEVYLKSESRVTFIRLVALTGG